MRYSRYEVESILREELQASKKALENTRNDPLRFHEVDIPKIFKEGYKYSLCAQLIAYKDLYIDYEVRALIELETLSSRIITTEDTWEVLQFEWRCFVVDYLLERIKSQ